MSSIKSVNNFLTCSNHRSADNLGFTFKECFSNDFFFTIFFYYHFCHFLCCHLLWQKSFLSRRQEGCFQLVLLLSLLVSPPPPSPTHAFPLCRNFGVELIAKSVEANSLPCVPPFIACDTISYISAHSHTINV